MADLRKHRKFKHPVGSPLYSPLVAPITDMDAAGGNPTGEMKVVLGRFSQRLVGARTNVIVTNFKKFSQNVIAAEEVSASVAVSFFKETKMHFGHEGFVSNWVEALGPVKMTLGTGLRSIDGANTRIRFSEKLSGHVDNGIIVPMGHIAQTFKKFTQQASGSALFVGGAISQRFKKFKQTVNAVSAAELGYISTNFPRANFRLSPVAHGWVEETGTASPRFKKMTTSVTAWQSPEFGTISQRFKKLILNEQAREKFVGSIDDMRFKGLQQHAGGMVFNGARVIVRFPGSVSIDAVGWDSAVGSSHIIFPKFGTKATGGQGHENGFIEQTFKLIQQQVLAGEEEFAQVAQTFPLMVTSVFATSGTIAQEDDMIPQGRLTLTTAVPVLTSDVTGAGTVYYTPFVGNKVPLWNGSDFASTAFSELSQALSDTTKSPAAAASNSLYDMFVWNDGGTVRCTRGPAWSSNTSRGTGAGTSELQRVNGMLVNANAITNGPAAGFGTYVGTFATDGSTLLNMMFSPTPALGGTANRLDVWNMYNRRAVSSVVRDSTNSWTYGTASFRAVNGSDSNRVTFVVGVDEDVLESTCQSAVLLNTTASWLAITAVGLDSTTVMADGGLPGVFGANTSFTVHVTFRGSWSGRSGIGSHYVQWLEYSLVSRTFYGDNGSPTTEQNGLVLKAMM